MRKPGRAVVRDPKVGRIDRRGVTRYSCQQAAGIAVPLTPGARDLSSSPAVCFHPPRVVPSSIPPPVLALLPLWRPLRFHFRIPASRPQLTPVYRLRFVPTPKLRGEEDRKRARGKGGVNENSIRRGGWWMPVGGCSRILLAVSWTASAFRLQINCGVTLRNFVATNVALPACTRAIAQA
jgi:hypothetical protein